MASALPGLVALIHELQIGLVDERRWLQRVVHAFAREVPRGEAGVIIPERRADAAGMLSDRLQETIGAPLREMLWERSALSASVAGLAVDAAQAEARLRA